MNSQNIGLYLAPPDKALVLCCDEKGLFLSQGSDRREVAAPPPISHLR